MMFYPIFYLDPAYVLILIGTVISMAASAKFNSTYRRYSAARSICDMTGADAVKRLLVNQGIYDMIVHRVPGNLTDHYNPKSKTINLSDVVYNSTSITAIGMATHECGHATQDANDYLPLGICTVLVSTVNLEPQLYWPLIIIGLLLGGSSALLSPGILLLCLAVLLQLVTPPVKYDASHRAATLLDSTGVLAGQEVGQTRKVLNAAVLTYVAAAVASILQLLRLLILFGNRRDD